MFWVCINYRRLHSGNIWIGIIVAHSEEFPRTICSRLVTGLYIKRPSDDKISICLLVRWEKKNHQPQTFWFHPEAIVLSPRVLDKNQRWSSLMIIHGIGRIVASNWYPNALVTIVPVMTVIYGRDSQNYCRQTSDCRFFSLMLELALIWWGNKILVGNSVESVSVCLIHWILSFCWLLLS